MLLIFWSAFFPSAENLENLILNIAQAYSADCKGMSFEVAERSCSPTWACGTPGPQHVRGPQGVPELVSGAAVVPRHPAVPAVAAVVLWGLFMVWGALPGRAAQLAFRVLLLGWHGAERAAAAPPPLLPLGHRAELLPLPPLPN